MKHLVFLIVLSASLWACSTQQPEWDYAKLSGEATPASWNKSDWVFVAVDKERKVIRSMTVRFTDEPAETCIGGDWKKIEILGDTKETRPTSLAEPAYLLDGRALTVGLSANLCDNYEEFQGELSDKGFTGKHHATGLGFYETYGTVFGARVISND